MVCARIVKHQGLLFYFTPHLLGYMTVKKHKKYSSSAAYRYLNCPGSIALSEKAPPQTESKYSREGSDAHTVFEYVLLGRPIPDRFPKAMIDHAKAAALEVLKHKPDDAELLVEVKAPLDFIHPDAGGTLDVAIVDLFGTLHIIDYKYGAGHIVEPKDNPQLIAYALSVAHKYNYNFEDVVLMIIQPRGKHKSGTVRSDKMSIDDILFWKARFELAIKRTIAEPETYVPNDEWCRWCPAKIICPALSTDSLAQAQIDFGSPVTTTPNLTKLDSESLGDTLSAIERLEIWIKEVRDYAFKQLEKGKSVKGYKLVPKRATRVWADPEKAARQAEIRFGSKAFKRPELLTPAQLEKLNPKWVNARCVKVSSGLTLVPDNDERAAATKAALDFDDVPNDDL